MQIIEILQNLRGHAIYFGIKPPFSFEMKESYQVHGFKKFIKVGDIIVIFRDKWFFYFIVENINYKRDPSDMFFASIKYIGYDKKKNTMKEIIDHLEKEKIKVPLEK